VTGIGGEGLATGATYSWAELGERFDFKPAYFSVAGGIIARPQHDSILLMTHPGGARSFDYGDYWDGDELVYTGRGQRGDQERTGANRDVGENGGTLHVFQPAGAPRELLYVGAARCVGEWTDTAPDGDGEQRSVLRFRLRFSEPALAATDQPYDASDADRAAEHARKPRPFDPGRVGKPARPKGWTRTPEEILALQEKARKGHQELLVRLAVWLEGDRWSDIEEIEGAVDLWATPRRGHRVIFEAKTMGSRASVGRVRGALGQLLEYRYFYGEPDDELCIVSDRPIGARAGRMLDSLGVAMLWRDEDGFRPGNATGDDSFG
jgi:hypothetical protein